MANEMLVETLVGVRKFIEYARYELQPGEMQSGDQFPRQGCADKRLAKLDEAIALLASSGWQPIETAPKMRKIIVTYLNALGKRRTVMGCYYLAHSLEMHDDYAEVGTYDEATGESFAPEGWYEEHDSDSPLMPLQEAPTHWMPLPDPPSAGGR